MISLFWNIIYALIALIQLMFMVLFFCKILTMRHERYESEFKAKLREHNIGLSEHLGQHMLIDEGHIGTFVGQIQHGVNVLEVGPGPGNLTKRMAEKAKRVVGIEIDRKFQPLLDEVQAEYPNVEIIYKDAMAVDFKKIVEGGFLKRAWQIASNLPFHISEPFLQKIIEVPIEDATLIVGEQLAKRMQIDRPDDPEFSKTSLITQTFFEPSTLARIGREAFYPQPRTDASLVSLHPRDKREFESNPGRAILRNLFLSERKNPTVAKVIKESTGSVERRQNLSKTENHRLERRRSRQEMRQLTRDWQSGTGASHRRNNTTRSTEVEKLDLPQDILSKPFSRLDNQDLRVLVTVLKRRYG